MQWNISQTGSIATLVTNLLFIYEKFQFYGVLGTLLDFV